MKRIKKELRIAVRFGWVIISGIKNFAEVSSAKHIRQRKSWQKKNT